MKTGGRLRSVRKILAGTAILLCGLWTIHAWEKWGALQELPPNGGLYFPFQIEASVPAFAQTDPRWAADFLGPTNSTLAEEGCALTSAAMALSFYGFDVDPRRLNVFLETNRGYTPQGWIYWEAAAEFDPGKVRHAYESLPSHRLIDLNLARKNPVIVRIRRPGGGKHFVVLTGKKGCEYIALDPGAGGRRVLLSELGCPIEALRFYERL